MLSILKIFVCSFLGIPGPLSTTSMTNSWFRLNMLILITPSFLSLYLMALETRFCNTWCRRIGSKKASATWISVNTWMSFGGEQKATTSSTNFSKSIISGWFDFLPAIVCCKIPSTRFDACSTFCLSMDIAFNPSSFIFPPLSSEIMSARFAIALNGDFKSCETKCAKRVVSSAFSMSSPSLTSNSWILFLSLIKDITCFDKDFNAFNWPSFKTLGNWSMTHRVPREYPSSVTKGAPA